MSVRIEESWKTLLEPIFSEAWFLKLTDFVRHEYRQFRCYPPARQIFTAFDYCTLDNLKVVILGQDPYHGQGQANGLCFSVNENVKHPPSLVNIFKEMETDVGKPYPESGNLEHWAKQGVLLLNATLTVRAHQAGSHQNKGWETFTNAVIQQISDRKNGVVFMLWGGYAKKKITLINKKKHFVLSSGHPSPLSANRGYWFGNKHFSSCNKLLQSQKLSPINW